MLRMWAHWSRWLDCGQACWLSYPAVCQRCPIPDALGALGLRHSWVAPLPGISSVCPHHLVTGGSVSPEIVLGKWLHQYVLHPDSTEIRHFLGEVAPEERDSRRMMGIALQHAIIRSPKLQNNCHTDIYLMLHQIADCRQPITQH